MSAPLLMICASFLFATMGVCVKLASAHYGTGEIVMYRGLVGVAGIALVARLRGIRLRTRVPGMHAWRSVVGVTALSLWFHAIGHLPLATAVTLNSMSSVWMALFLIGGAVVVGAQRVDPRLVALVLVGFGGVALVLHPTLGQDQAWPGLIGLASGMLSALAYLQVTTLGRVGEPELRVVFYFSCGGALAGVVMAVLSGLHPHTATGIALLVAIGGARDDGAGADDPCLRDRSPAHQREPAVPGHRVLLRLRHLAVPRRAHLGGDGRHRADRRRRARGVAAARDDAPDRRLRHPPTAFECLT